MCPYFFNVIPSYGVMIGIGIVAALFLFCLYLKLNKVDSNSMWNLVLVGIASIIIGFFSAILFDNIYKTIKYQGNYTWGWSLTFMGGLFGGVATFLLLYFLLYKRHNPPLMDKILVIAPGCITIAHAFGRIGCFLSGCCYGLPTDSWIGVDFPGIGKVIPTQLIEAIILFILSAVLLFLAFKKVTNHTMEIYLFVYAIARFVLEFYRGDDRGQSLGLSPSQIWCIIMFVSIVPYFILTNKFLFKKPVK